MARLALINLQQELLKYFEAKLKTLNPESEGHAFLSNLIDNLKKDINPDEWIEKKNPKSIRYDPNVSQNLKRFGLTDDESKVFAVLLCNEKAQNNSAIARTIPMDRAKTYRALHSLEEKQLVIRSTYGVTYFTVSNRKNPLFPLIELQQQVLDNLKGFQYG